MKDRSLRDSLTQWTGLPKLGAAFEPYQTRSAAGRVGKLLQDIDPKKPARYDLQLLHGRVAKEWRRSYSLAKVSPRDLRQLPWVLFYPALADSRNWLGAKPRLLREYDRWLMSGRRTRSVLALLHEFLRAYPTDLPSFGALRTLLGRVMHDGISPPPASMQKWVRRSREFGFLDTDRGKRLVFDLLGTTADPEEVLHRAGLDGGLAHSGFLESGVRSVLPTCTQQLKRDSLARSRLQRLLSLLEHEGKLRFGEPSMRVQTAKAMLGPFVDRPPPAETKELLQSFFLRHFGDPRLPSGKHKWSGVQTDITRVVIRWLVERGMEQFFMLLKETAFDRHWRYREAFWRAFLNEGLIDDIWFVLGSRAARVLKSASKDPAVLETTAALKGAQSDQSVLLMRIPGVTIAEWSHNGACHMWLDGVTGAPKLYQQEYNVYEVRYGAHSQNHHSSPRGYWQDAIARWLRDNTGIELDRERYFPRRLRESQQRESQQRESRQRIHAPTVVTRRRSGPSRYWSR